jgi:hypothetical protein
MADHKHLRDKGMIPSSLSLVHLCREDEENHGCLWSAQEVLEGVHVCLAGSSIERFFGTQDE